MLAVPVERRTLSLSEVAESLGISYWTAYKMSKDGRLPVIRAGRRILVIKAAFERMLEGAGEGFDGQ